LFVGVERPKAAVRKSAIARKRRTLLALWASRVLEKSMICEILNYLLASLVRSSLAGCELPATLTGLPINKDIPGQRSQAVACECNGYVVDSFIGGESVIYIGSCSESVNKKFRLFIG
jgi:hypothetical protein